MKFLKFEIYEDNAGEYRWRLKARNGKQIADSSEGYKNYQDCVDAIGLIAGHAANAEIETERTS